MDITDVLHARSLLAPHLPPTPMWTYPGLDRATGTRIHLKHENTQPTGAFKVRGGLTLLSRMPAEQRRRGVVTWSTGNHAQSLAYAAHRFDTPCRIVMPEHPNPVKLRAAAAYGARIDCHGADMTGAGDHARTLADRHGLRLVSPADEPDLVAGVGTVALEMLTAQPDLSALVVPVGGGSGAAAAGLVAAALAPHCEVIAVQSAASPAAHDSWHAGELLTRPNRTAVEGLATGTGFALTQDLMRRHLTDFVLVDDSRIREAQRLILDHAHTLVEGAGAAALAAVLDDPPRFANRTIGLIATGANAGPAELRGLLDPKAEG